MSIILYDSRPCQYCRQCHIPSLAIIIISQYGYISQQNVQDTTVKIVRSDLSRPVSLGRGKGKLSFVPSWVGAIVEIVMLLIFVTRQACLARSNVVSMY